MSVVVAACLKADKSFHLPFNAMHGWMTHSVTLTPGRRTPRIAPSDTLRENETAHANTAAFTGSDLSIRATPKIAMTERSNTQTDI